MGSGDDATLVVYWHSIGANGKREFETILLFGSWLFGKRATHAKPHVVPVAIAEMADDRQL